jgi:rare lipoprotein A
MRFESLLLTAATVRSAGVAVLVASALAGCSQAPTGKRSKEFFPTSVYGAASPKVVADGEAVPRGGGRYLVGKPYTIAGRVYTPQEVAQNASQVGKASWYGAAFHGRRTSNGEVYDMRSLTAAHPTWPLPSYVRVTNTGNGRSMIVRLNDRGPFHAGRIMDVSSRVADALDFKRMGTANLKIDYIGKAGLAGSDDQLLLASLRTDGRPATLDGQQPTMIAAAEPERKPAQPEGPRWTFFQPESETTVVSRQQPDPLWSNNEPSPQARVSTSQVASAAPVQAIASSAAPSSPQPGFPPLPPVRPLSFR